MSAPTQAGYENGKGAELQPGQAIAARFGRARLLDRERHKNMQINRRVGFEFARRETAVPVVVTEFASAARDMPLVFAGEERLPIAILGIRPNQNLFVGDKGNWQPGRYVPAHLRRYPFIFQADNEGERFALCIDEAAEHFKATDVAGEPLFVAEEPAPLVTEMLNFLTDIQKSFTYTKAYVAALREEDLLVERNTFIELSSGEKHQLNGFYLIDENKFNALSAKTFNAWRQKGWVAYTYFHLQSQLNWSHLVDFAV